MPRIDAWETYRFNLPAIGLSGGHVTSVPVDCRMSGWPKSVIGKAWTVSVLFVPTGNFAITTPF